MKKHLLRTFGLAAVLSLSAFTVRAQTGWVFEGCWSPFITGTCYDVYRDAAGAYWRCKACGTTTKPSSKTCFQVSPYSTGYWCS
ncbi:MAG: hypothetical protein ACJ76Y_17550 [Thermoanaerobaculia bacterium]